jgi:hypothetical protein
MRSDDTSYSTYRCVRLTLSNSSPPPRIHANNSGARSLTRRQDSFRGREAEHLLTKLTIECS